MPYKDHKKAKKYARDYYLNLIQRFDKNGSIIKIYQKKCKTCECIKSIDNYYVAKNSKDGYAYQCKKCFCKRMKVYGKRPEVMKKERERCLARYYHPIEGIKHKARNTLGRAIRDKKIKREPCIKCGDLKSHGHHENYNQPLKVSWLCQKHHNLIHNK